MFSPGILECNKRRAEHKTCEATTEASTRKYGTIDVPSAGSRWNKAATRDDFSSCLKDFRSQINVKSPVPSSRPKARKTPASSK